MDAVNKPYITADKIYCTLGSPWLPSCYVEDFINGLLLTFSKKKAHVEYDATLKSWFIDDKSEYNGRLAATTTYGTRRINAIYIIERTLNMQAVVVYDVTPSKVYENGTTVVLNREETLAAAEKQRLIIKAFGDWIYTDPKRKADLERIYNERFVIEPPKEYDGSGLVPIDLNKDISLYPYQLDAVERILESPTALLAHDVGAGKTFAMIVAGMELKKRGISAKNMYVVPNNILWQWKEYFKLLYPEVNLLIIDPKTFVPAKRAEALEKLRDGEYDAIIIAYSSLELIPVSKRLEKELVDEQIAKIKDAEIKNKAALPRLFRREEQLKKQRQKLVDELKKEAVSGEIYFQDLHVNTLFVDEAHNFKNITIETKSSSFAGINKCGSGRGNDMLTRVWSVLNENGRGVVFATGTPITNSITDLFVMQTYLQHGMLRKMDLANFDNWIGMFGELKTNFEVDVDATGYRLKTKFDTFHNLGELAAAFARIADFHRLTDRKGLPCFEGYTDITVHKNDYQANYIRTIALRADAVRKGGVPREEDNLLKITTDGRKAALDMRLIDGYGFLDTQPKVASCAEEVYLLWCEGVEKRLTQLVFCDISTPKEGFNIYSELKSLLIEKGVPEGDVAFIHDATGEREKEELCRRTNIGEIRVLIGSTMKLGTGVNVQERLIAVHHLDIPWRPSDMIQREGRILRQGNLNPSIKIFRYITDGSFDAYSWQILESKQRFITQLLSNDLTTRTCGDVDESVLTYAEIKALAIGNPLIKKRVDTYNELCRLRVLQKRAEEARIEAETAIRNLPERIEKSVVKKEKLNSDALTAATNPPSFRKETAEAVMKAVAERVATTEENVINYRQFSLYVSTAEDGAACVYVKGKGLYKLKVGDSAIGVMQRIDNFMNSLPTLAEKEAEKLSDLKIELSESKHALSVLPNYGKEINSLVRTIEETDAELGVNNYA